MSFLPIEKITYKTRLNQDEIFKRLSEIVEPKKILRFGIFRNNSSKTYEGEFNTNSFEIQRIISYRNSFLPIINGTIEKEFDGMAIHMKMRLHVFVMIFLCIWCGVILLATIILLSQTFSNWDLGLFSLIPIGMLLFAYVLTMGAFKYESNKSKKELQNLFEAEISKF